MTKRLTPDDAIRLGRSHGLELLDGFQSPTQPVRWRDALGNAFRLSLNSLKRRLRQAIPASPVQARQAADAERQAAEYHAVVSIAARNGLTVTSPLQDYRQQTSLLTVTCGRCQPCTAQPMTAAKLKAGQVCHLLGREKQADARRLPFARVQATVRAHPEGLELLSVVGEYQNNVSPLRLRCVNGHDFTMTLSDLQRRRPCRGCPECGRTRGQATATAILEELLGVPAIKEYSPAFLLERWPADRDRLRLDAFFPGVTLAGRTIDVALEYQGRQHSDPAHHFHQRSRYGAKEAYARLQQGDRHKREACARRPDTALLTIDDREHRASLPQLRDDLIAALAAALPRLTGDVAYQERVARLSKNAELEQRLRERHLAGSDDARLRTELDWRGIDLLHYDPVSCRAQCRCRRHGTEWEAHANNLLDGVSVERKGTGCPDCKREAVGRHKRLKEATVIARAASRGWRPRWSPGTYLRQSQKLDWACLNPACNADRHTDFEHLMRSRCQCQRT